MDDWSLPDKEQEDILQSEEIQQAVHAIVSNDTERAPQSNVIDDINALFPDENSLSTINNKIVILQKKIKNLNQDLINSVNKQLSSTALGKIQLDRAREAIHELANMVVEIKSKAGNSEQVVNDICKDILDLDYAKSNLTSTIDALNKLQWIMDDMKLLRTLLDQRHYSDAASTLERLNENFEIFQSFKDIDRVKELIEMFETLKLEKKPQIFDEFEHINVTQLSVEEIYNIYDACLVIDLMGLDTRKEFVKHFCERQLILYQLQFKPNADISQLKHVDGRYQWYLKWLSRYEQHYTKVFPRGWRVSECVAEEFCLITNQNILELLEKMEETIDVKELKLALKNTIKFEKLLSCYFVNQSKKAIEHIKFTDMAMIPRSDLTTNIQPSDIDFEQVNQDLEPRKISGPSMEKLTDNFPQLSDLSQVVPAEEIASQVMRKFKGIISRCFEHYMYLYLNNRRELVEQEFNKFLSQETWTLPKSTLKFFVSARRMIELFSEVRRSVVSFNQGQAFFDTFLIFKEYLTLYADKLLNRLSIINTQTPASSSLHVLATTQDTTADDILCCTIINTGEYCASMCNTIQRVVQSEISSEFKDQVVLDHQLKKYSNISVLAHQTLSRLIASALEPAFIEISRTNWDALKMQDNVADSSHYVSIISDYLHEHILIFKTYIMSNDSFHTDDGDEMFTSPDYFQIICDSILVYFTRRYQLAIRSCRISEAGAQQLLTDVAQLKRLLEVLPTLGSSTMDTSTTPMTMTSSGHLNLTDEDGNKGIGGEGGKHESIISNDSLITKRLVDPFATFKVKAFGRKVQREMQGIEKMLKMIWTPQDVLIDTFKALLPDENDTYLVMIMQLKNMKIQDQQLILDAYGSPRDSPARSLVSQDRLASTSRISMDTTTQTLKDALFNVFGQG